MTEPRTEAPAARRPAPRRDHLVRVATSLFCREGFHATGIDRVLAEAGVAKMTLYKHFASKDELIAACLAAVHREAEAAIEATLAAANGGPAERALALVLWHAETAQSRAFGGCPFHHARAEFSNPEHPAHQAAQGHKGWVRARLVGLLGEAQHPAPREAAQQLEVVIEGMLAAGALGKGEDLARAGEALARSILFPA